VPVVLRHVVTIKLQGVRVNRYLENRHLVQLLSSVSKTFRKVLKISSVSYEYEIINGE